MAKAITYSINDGIALLGAHNPPVNALSQTVRQELLVRIERAEREGAKAVVIYGGGRTYFAGADIREFGKPPQDPWLPDVCARIEASRLLVVSAMHGTVLGGGLEISLATHYRIATPETRMGLPEVHLGLIPGAGGTQRLPRLVGAAVAVDLISGGRRISAQKALEMGIIDRVTTGIPPEIGLAYAKELLQSGARRRPTSELPAPNGFDFSAACEAVRVKSRGQLSPVYAVNAVQAACEMPFREGMARERALFAELMGTDQRKGMVHAFFSERAVGKLPELENVAPRNVDRLAVVGGGTMGAGIATAALLSGLQVTLLELSQEAARKAGDRVEANLRGALKRGKINETQFTQLTKQAMSLVTDFGTLGSADLIIEAVFEDMEVKKSVFRKLDSVAKRGAVLATNTSYLDVDEIASVTSRQTDVLGLHFFSPAHVMRLLEVVVADATVPETVATGFAFGRRLGKVPVRAGVCDGFIGNRILSAYRTAADRMVLEGASPFRIDRIMTDFGFPMGPYEVADLAGLDIGWAMRKRKRMEGFEAHAVDSSISDRLCEAGHFGQKTGKGYYLHEPDQRAGLPNPDVELLAAAERTDKNITPREFSDEEILRRYMAAMVNEAAKVVEEGIARRPLDVDTVLLLGYGFPRYRGGPCKWADMCGLPELLADLRRFVREDACFWRPARLLERLVANNRLFEDLNQG